MSGDIDPVSGKPTSQLEYSDWQYSQTHSNIPGEPKYRYTTVWRTRDVYQLEHGTKRKLYTQKEQYGDPKRELTGAARTAAVEELEYKSAQKAVEAYEKAADTDLPLEIRHDYAREAKYQAGIGKDYLVEAKPGEPTTGKVIPITDPTLLKEERHWRYDKEVPEHFKQRVTVPEDVKRLGLREQYLQESYAVSMGYKPEHVATQEWQRTYEQAYYEKHPPAKPVAIEEKPKERSVWDIGDWIKDPLGTLTGGAMDLFAPISERAQYAYASLTQPLHEIKPKLIQESEEMRKIRESGREMYRQQWEKGDWLGMSGRVISSVPALPFISYGLGKTMGGLAATKLGQKELFQIGIGEKVIGSAPAWTYKYTISVTPSKLVGGSIATGFGYVAGKSGVEAYKKGDIGRWLGVMAVTMPFVYYPYKWGYHSGMGWVQRRSAMSKVTGVDRVRQKGIYEAIDKAYKMPEPRFKTKPFDIVQIQRIDTSAALRVSQYLRSERGRFIFSSHPKIGGSASTYMQLPRGWFRTDGQPYSIQKWAFDRQYYSWKIGLQSGVKPKTLIGKEMPGDIDILIRDIWGGMKRAEYLKQPHVVDIHPYKTGAYYGFGKIQLKPTTGTIYDPWISLSKIKTLSLREQFMRKGISILPSETKITGYRSYKDIPDFWDIGEALGIKMGKIAYPEQYPIPKVTWGERFIKAIGGTVEPKWVETFGGMFIEPVYPTGMYPKPYTPLLIASTYPISPYKTISYPPTKYVAPDYPSVDYPTVKPVSYKYPVSTKIQIKTPSTVPTPIYKPKKQPVPTYITPSYPTPDIPIYPTTIHPIPDIPTYIPPPYPTPSYPRTPPPIYPIPPPPEKKKKLPFPSAERKKRLEEPRQGYNVFVKSRQYYQGKPQGTEKYRKLTTKSFSHSDAKSLLGSALDHSIAQTGYIKPSGKPAQKLHKSIPSRWDNISYKFSRKNGKIMEQRAYAIDTKGESQELNVFQWHRRLPKKKTAKKSRIVEYPTTAVDMYSFERFNDKFNKMLRRRRVI